MSGTADKLRGYLDLLDEVTELLVELKDHPHAVDWDLAAPPDSVPFDDRISWQKQERESRINPRVEVVAPIRSKLDAAWPALDRLASRYLGSAFEELWSCAFHSPAMTTNPIGGMCRWSCKQCCEGGLRFVQSLREKVGAELRALGARAPTDVVAASPEEELSPEERRRVFDAGGKLSRNAREFLLGLPAKTLADVAVRSGLTKDAAKKISAPLRKAGYVRKTRHDGWVRANRRAGT